jgi:UDP-GalNAc:undecaprenyl-phosphate GalNAc-1-phosphate transferase
MLNFSTQFNKVMRLQTLSLLITFISLFAVILSSWVALGSPLVWQTFAQPSVGGLMIMCFVGCWISTYLTWRWGRFPHAAGSSSAIFATLGVFLGIAVLLLVSRWWYSRPYLFSALFLNLIFNVGIQRWRSSLVFQAVGLPDLAVQKLVGLPKVNLQLLTQVPAVLPSMPIVADLRNQHSSNWVRFLLECSLKSVPVLDASRLLEGLTGRVSVDLLQEDSTPFAASRLYLGIKRVWESCLIVLSSPLWLPLMGLVAVAVRLDSKGPIMFFQQRVGLGGRVFQIAKFRSMSTDSEKAGAQFAQAGDARVTRVGKVIRKFRLDELPQFWNVLRGDMALIGPRPEQAKFVEAFSQNIPLYGYRHLVRPGITGWAQVVQGYAANTDETREKLEYDLYYVKHFSLLLDILVVLKTLRVILTGFGAR